MNPIDVTTAPSRGEEDPFACFGDDEGSSCCSDENDEETSSFDNDTENSKRHQQQQAGQRLCQEANVRQNQYSAKMTIDFNDACDAADFGYEIYSCSHQKGFETTSSGEDEQQQMGIRAKRRYKAGEEILREKPVMRINTAIPASSYEEAQSKLETIIQSNFDTLSPSIAQSIMELTSCKQNNIQGDEDDSNATIKHKKKTPIGIFQTNSYQLEQDSGYGAIFMTTSRMNHSCRANVSHYWRPDLHMMILHAARDIEIGEEMCTCYGPTGANYFVGTSKRQDYLREKYAFNCSCEMCQEGNAHGGDDRMIEIQQLHETIALLLMRKEEPRQIKQKVDHCLDLLVEQGIGNPKGPHVASILHYGYQISDDGLDDPMLAIDYLQRELLSVQSSQGRTSYKSLDIQHQLSIMMTAATVQAK